MSTTGAVGDPYNNSSWPSVYTSTTGFGGGGGPAGSVQFNTVTGTVGYSINNSTYTIAPTGPAMLNSDVRLDRPGKDPILLGKTIDAILERLCIIIPAMDKLEKYPALKEAYENYKLIEALIQNDESEKK